MPTKKVGLGVGFVWPEEVWLHVIDIVQKVEEEDIAQSNRTSKKSSYTKIPKQKWELVTERLQEKLRETLQVDSTELKKLTPEFTGGRFYSLKAQVKGGRTRYRKGDIPSTVFQRMKEYLQFARLPRKSLLKAPTPTIVDAVERAKQGYTFELRLAESHVESSHGQRTSGANKQKLEVQEEDLKDFKSACSNFEDDRDKEEFRTLGIGPEDSDSLSGKTRDSCDDGRTETRLREQVDVELNALRNWFCYEVIPMARTKAYASISSEPDKKRLKTSSSPCTSEDLLDVSAAPEKGLQLKMLTEFQHLRVEISTSTRLAITNLVKKL